MKAAICLKYGPCENVKVMDVERPKYKSDEVLIKVMASALNTGDVRIRGLIASPFTRLLLRVVMGIKKPRQAILGAVLAGEIVEIGADVKRFSVGDQVFAMTGFRFGAHAQYAVLNESSTLALKPKGALYEEAAVLPFGGNTALHFLRKAGIKPGDKVLIYGASGSVGTSAVQIAKYFGAEVTAVCSAKHSALVLGLGANHHLDYQHGGLEQHKEVYDIVFDCVDKTSKKQMHRLLNANGRFISVSGYGIAKETASDLVLLAKLYEAGKISAVIDRAFSLESIADAHCYVEQRTKAGNVVITIPHP